MNLAKAQGEFVWHHLDDGDELFLVTSGELRIEFRDEPDVVPEEGELVIAPCGVEHRPVAENPYTAGSVRVTRRCCSW